ncbi:LysR family transcriptional regulator [Leisingera daeponensis]|uniref:LysR family transcriptional regulator n=1 Tax=Leisingera daeponensis TaxID=405746 RepID=UPI001C94A356|nr:LysR family transcriptional regulator [Leisingera daeponensis]MBY6059436.1 LysR family transcriptional regulator [Leisingera daeponensis]
MDTEVVKTFIEVASSGSFGRAAERLNVAQTTVSARIKRLEGILGRQLLIRRKSGAELTRSGEHFLRQAPAFVQFGERLQKDFSVPEGFSSVLSLGGEVSVASTWMNRWARRLVAEMPETALHIKIDIPEDLPDRFSEGLIDAALMHTPPKREGLKTDLLIEDRLMLFTTDPSIRSVYDSQFVYVDWGEDFAASFKQSYPNFESSAVSFDCGPLAGEYILTNGGIAYGRQRSALPFLETGRISLVEEAATFSYPVYIVRPANIPNPTLDRAIAVLRKIISDEGVCATPNRDSY